MLVDLWTTVSKQRTGCGTSTSLPYSERRESSAARLLIGVKARRTAGNMLQVTLYPTTRAMVATANLGEFYSEHPFCQKYQVFRSYLNGPLPGWVRR